MYDLQEIVHQLSIPTNFDDLRWSLHSQGVPTKYLCPYPPNPPKPHFGEPFNAKPIIERVLRKSYVNKATKLKFYIYIGIGKYLSVCRNFFRQGRLGGEGVRSAPQCKWDPHNISETTRARKLNLKIGLPFDMVKYPLWVQKNFCQGAQGPLY